MFVDKQPLQEEDHAHKHIPDDANNMLVMQQRPPHKPRVYPQRWIQLLYLSLLAWLSDWVCFSLAASPEAFEEHYDGRSSSDLIDVFLFVNVASSFFVTDLVAKFGLQKTMRACALCMTVGCWCRSGIFCTLMPYHMVVIGTCLVGVAQPFVQCTPPLLSAQWFASDERATSTAIALNFNQVGIATAFLVGGNMASSVEGLARYFPLISTISTLLCVGVFVQFQSLPPTPPSTSEMSKLGTREPPFVFSVKSFFSTPGFTRPLVAFVCSISVTNIVGAFIDQFMRRGGITHKFHVALAGSAFEIAIVLGGILIGGYVDRTKRYKRVTLACLAASLIFLVPLGLVNHKWGPSPAILVLSLFGLGLVAGPIQPINAELAVDVVYPGDETAVESVQQIGGNLISAILVPMAQRAAKADYELLPNVPLLSSDVRGDILLLLVLTGATFWYFKGFHAPLKRTIADRNDNGSDAPLEEGVEMVLRDDEMGRLLLDNDDLDEIQTVVFDDDNRMQ